MTSPPKLRLSRTYDAKAGEVTQVSPLVRRILAPNPGPLTFTGTNTWIAGRGEVAIIDPGPDDEAHLAALLNALEGERVVAIFVTHTHFDHSPLARKLAARTGAPVHGYGPHAANRARGSVIAPSLLMRQSGDGDFRPDAELRDGDEVRGPGWSLRALHTPGHIPNHLCYELREERALFSGDHVMGWSTTIIAPPDGFMADYLASLDKLLAHDHLRYWPGHGPEIENPAAHVAALKAHRLRREADILTSVRQGARTLPQIIARIYPGLPDNLREAAGLSTLAALEHLLAKGRIKTPNPLGPDAHFEAA